MKTRAAILASLGRPLEVAEIEIPSLKAGQVLVEVQYSGVCHTQLLEVRGYRGEDKFLPHCLGHEGSGIVRAVGPGVTKVRPGDSVILSWIKGSGAEVPQTLYRWGAATVNAGGIATFLRHAVISENRLTPIPPGLLMDQMALLGCAVPTGAGAVFNTARPKPGQSIAIFGVGGIGLCAVSAAVISGCVPIIAIDLRASQLALALEAGATDVIDASASDVIAETERIAPGGVDFAIEASGRPAVMVQALRSVRNQGGAAVVVGNAHYGESLSVEPREFNLGKRLLGTWGGDNVPERDFPRYLRLVMAGRMRLDVLISGIFPLERVNDALDGLEAGRESRPLIAMSDV